MAEPISRELFDEKFDRLHEKLDMIHEQTTTTNGRVTRLEQWKSAADGALKVLILLFVPVLIYIVQGWMQ